MRPPLLVPLLLAAGCGGSGADTVSTQPTRPATSLTVAYSAGEDTDPTSWTLTCDPDGGDHPQAAAACRRLAGLEDPFAPIPVDAVCTEQYGGPQTATVSGSHRGRPVELSLSRVNGCHISQWERLVPLVPAGS